MSLTIYTLPPSPNSIKTAIALSMKGIEAEAVNIMGMEDRSVVIEATGQPLTPAIVHNGTVLFDSNAILRYLDANFRDSGPRLYTTSYDGMRDIETWEKFGNTELSQVIRMVIGQFFTGKDDPEATAKAQKILDEASLKIEEALAEKPYLTGDTPNAADIVVFAWCFHAQHDPEAEHQNPVHKHFANKLQMPKERVKTLEWMSRMAKFL